MTMTQEMPAFAQRATTAAALQLGRAVERIAGYNFAYLDEQTKRMIRRALLKAVAPGLSGPRQP